MPSQDNSLNNKSVHQSSAEFGETLSAYDFTIVFEKLAELETTVGDSVFESSDQGCEELEHIDELRRLVVEMSEPDPTTYTTT